MFGADAAETPGDIAYGDSRAGMKSSYRNDQEVVIKGDFGNNKFKVLQYWAKESSSSFDDFAYGDTMYTRYSSGTEWLGFQAKDDIHVPVGEFFLKPIVTLGLDFNAAESWSRKWQGIDDEIAPYSPDSREKDVGIYTQLFGDVKDGLATAVVGLRFDVITTEIPESDFFPNNKPREETFNVFSPSYGLTFSPLKLLGDDYSLTVYHNLGKGFVPQPAGNVAGYGVAEPDTTGRVQVIRGNPDLEPESNITVDGGIRAGVKAVGLELGVGVYRTIVENYVKSVYDEVPDGMTETYDGATYPVAAIRTYENNDDITTMAGFEWDLEWNVLRLFDKPGKLAIGTNGHAVLLSENITETDTSEVHNVRNPNYTISLTYDDSRRLSARLQTRFSGRQKDKDWAAGVYPTPEIIYPPFLVTDFAMRVKVNEHHAVGAQVSNITDENYYEKRGYNMPGRTFGLSYELSF
jgi:outer membrane receptor protein involved in Fe transport